MLEKLIEVIAEALEIDRKKLELDTMKGNIDEWDSLGHLIVISMVESEFNVKIPFEEVSEINTIRDFLKYIK